MRLVPAPVLEKLCVELLVAAGTPEDIAAPVAESLVASDLRGHESHGAMRSTRYIARIRDGTLQPAARPGVLHRRHANAVVDGRWGFGQISAQLGVDLAISIGREHGQAGVALRHTHHIGRLGAYAETIAAAGLIGVVLSGGGVRGGSVAPYGSRERLLGTNPIAMAVPTSGRRSPLVLDFATSELAEGKLAVALANRQPIAAGAAIDAGGRPTSDPAAFYNGGALLPFGGHKGSALMLMIEIIATALAGSAPIALPCYTQGNPTFILAWSVDAFVPRAIFASHVDDLVTRIKQSQPAAGFAEVLVPGELEARHLEQRRREGIPLSDGVWRELCTLAASLNVPMPLPVAAPDSAPCVRPTDATTG